jgi:hypothetical protein
MSVIVTPNAFQGPLNQKPQSLFPSQGITDPIVQQNFEKLNKVLSQGIDGRQIQKANIAFGTIPSAVYTFPSGVTTLQTPGFLQVQITTRGNPVAVKLSGYQYGGNPSTLALTNATDLKADFGWLRNGVTVFKTRCEYKTISAAASISIPLPAFEFEDVVPAGQYTYQFFFQAYGTTNVTGFFIVPVAKELR